MRSACAFTKFLQRPTVCARRSWPSVTESRGADDAIRCDACPVLCYIKPGRTGSCDRYGNQDGKLVRLDPHVVLDRALSRGDSVVPFLENSAEWNGALVGGGETFVTA